MRAGRRFTLVELLVALAIVAVLLSISVGVLARLGNRDRLTATQQAVRAMLRRARNAAREERYPVTVQLEVERSRIRAQQKTAVTQFSFEEALVLEVPAPTGVAPADVPPSPLETPGARDFVLNAERAEHVQGRFGGGLLFEWEGTEGAAWAWCEDQPALTPLEGLHLECWLFLGRLEDRLHQRRPPEPTSVQEQGYARAGEPPRPAPPRMLQFDALDPPIFWAVRKGRSYGLGVTAAYELELTLNGFDADGAETTFITRTRPRTLRPDRWYRVAAAYDGRAARILVDGIGRQALPLPGFDRPPARLARDPEAPLAVSDPDPRASFYGVIDELKLAGLTRARTLDIPPDVAIVAPGAEVTFDLLGQLDPARHPEPFVIFLSDDDRLYQAVTVSDDPAVTRTRAQQKAAAEAAARGDVLVGPDRFEKFLDVLPELDPARVRRLVVERTGLVTD